MAIGFYLINEFNNENRTQRNCLNFTIKSYFTFDSSKAWRSSVAIVSYENKSIQIELQEILNLISINIYVPFGPRRPISPRSPLSPFTGIIELHDTSAGSPRGPSRPGLPGNPEEIKFSFRYWLQFRRLDNLIHCFNILKLMLMYRSTKSY